MQDGLISTPMVRAISGYVQLSTWSALHRYFKENFYLHEDVCAQYEGEEKFVLLKERSADAAVQVIGKVVRKVA